MGVAALAHLLGPVAPVPGLDRVRGSLRLHLRQQLGALALQRRHRARPDIVEQAHHRTMAARHRVGQRVIGKTGVAEQRGLFGAQLEDFADHAAVVGRAVVFAAGGPRAPSRLAQITPLAERQEGHDQRARQGDHRAGQAAVGCSLSRRIAHEGRQARHVGLAGQRQAEGRLIGQDVLAEGRHQRRQALVLRRETLAIGALQARAGADEITVQLLEQALLLGRQAQRGAARVQRIEPREQALVQVDRVAVRRHRLRQLALRGLQGIGGLRRAEVVERAVDAREQPPAGIEPGDGVGEARRLGIRGDGIELAAVLAHRHLEGRREVLGPDGGKRR